MNLQQIRAAIEADKDNAEFSEKNWKPVYSASPSAKIAIIGQAPGKAAQESHIPWDDISGRNLRNWMSVTDEEFYNEKIISLIPMDFYYPGKGKSGDLPPRKDFAPKWHPLLLDNMPKIELFILIGQYAQKHYLGDKMQRNLTETVRAFRDYGPDFFPIVHPSPLNARWLAKNQFFERDVLPELKAQVRKII